MARPLRVTPAGVPFHVVNRGNEKRRLFRNAREYDHFVQLLEQSCDRFPITYFSYCLMPNHWHIVVVGHTDHAISETFHWVEGTHACDLRRRENSVGLGHVYQRRFRAFAIGSNYHLLSVVRYVEANPWRAKLVDDAEDWRWSSLWDRPRASTHVLSDLPCPIPENWSELVNAAPSPQIARRLRESIQHDKPYGPPRWVKRISKQLRPTRKK